MAEFRSGRGYAQRTEGELERRRTVRYNLCLPLVFEWTDESGAVIQQPGFTRDISTGGLYVSCATSPPMNSTIRLQMVLPSNKEVFPENLTLAATARVVRFASQGEAAGFAAVGDLGSRDGDQKREIHVIVNNKVIPS